MGHGAFAQAPLPPATVSFLDGSFLRGEIESLNGEVLKWRHPNARQFIEFTTTNLNLIRLPTRSPLLPTNAGPVCRVQLASGDEFEGQLLSLDGETFEVETWFAGRLRGQRAGLASLAFYGSSQSALYDGPRAAEEWKVSSGATVFNRGGIEFFGGGNVLQPGVAIRAVVPAPQLRVVEPARIPAPAVVPDRRTKELVNALLGELTRQQQTVIVNYIVGWELALLDGQRRGPNVGVPVPPAMLPRREGVVNGIAPPLAPQIDPAASAVQIEIPRRLETAPARPPVPPVDLSAPAVVKPIASVAAPVARRTFAEGEVTKLTEAAERAVSVAEFLKSELVTIALAEKQTSRATLDRWFAEFADAVDWQGDAVKTARFKAMVRAEADLLGRRLLGRAAMFVELPPEAVEAQARGNAAANALADARARALDALRLNMANPNLLLGAEGALAGRPAAGVNSNAAWTFRNGAFYTTGVGTLGRECNLPAKARVEFDMAWKGQPYFRFQFYGRNPEQFDMSDGWNFYVSASGYIYPMRRSGVVAGGVTSARVPQMVSKSTVRLTFLIDREKETALLLADGEKIYEWKNLGRPGDGTGIVFNNYNISSRIRISDIRISPWDGRDRTADPASADTEMLAAVPPADGAVVEFANQDRATGTLHGIRDGKLTFNPAGTKLELPLARAALISFPVNAAPALLKGEGVQVTLHRNERLTLALEKWETEEIIAVSPVFGRLRLKPESIRTLRFNPTAVRGLEDEWGGP